ncbi:MAG: hypothetical protein AB1752_11350 [Candidatus Zixiibacteriota bacterium]
MLNARNRFFAATVVFLAISLVAIHQAPAKPQPQPVDLQFSRTDIQIVLSALASSVGVNLVMGAGVEGPIDVQLTGVDWETALSTIVSAHGFHYFWNDEVLVVLAGDQGSPDGLEHQVVTLRYADPVSVRAALANALSSRGKIDVVGSGESTGVPESIRPRPVLVVTEVAHRMPELLRLISSLDVAVPQFEISVKFVETDLDESSAAGISWPTRIDATLSDREGAESGTEGTTRIPPAAEYPIPDGKIWRFGTFSVEQLSAFVEFMRRKGSARILSDPRVTVLENEKAVMKVLTTIPVQTLNRFTEGAIIEDIVDFQDLEVGITLTVVPRLNEDGQITLDVEPVVEEITGYTGPVDNQRPITATRSVKTNVRVADGETLVLGGLVKENKFTTKNRVFLLGDIPILGALFSHTTVESEKSDLLIFITPRLLTAAP